MDEFYEKELLQNPLLKKEDFWISGLPSMKSVISPLAESVLIPSGLSERMLTADAAIQKKFMDQAQQHL